MYTDITNARSATMRFQSQAVTVAGIIKTGLEEYDESVVLCTFSFLQKLFPDSGPSQLRLRLHSLVDLPKVHQQLKDTLPITSETWHDLYPSLVSAMILERYAMFFILSLVTLVASMSIVSLLYMIIANKRPNIAILSAMGMPAFSIARIFILLAAGITTSACILGIMLACLVSYIIKNASWIQLPDAYYVSHLPANVTGEIIISVFVAVHLIAAFAIWLPTRRISRLPIATILRFEG